MAVEADSSGISTLSAPRRARSGVPQASRSDGAQRRPWPGPARGAFVVILEAASTATPRRSRHRAGVGPLGPATAIEHCHAVGVSAAGGCAAGHTGCRSRPVQGREGSAPAAVRLLGAAAVADEE